MQIESDLRIDTRQEETREGILGPMLAHNTLHLRSLQLPAIDRRHPLPVRKDTRISRLLNNPRINLHKKGQRHGKAHFKRGSI